MKLQRRTYHLMNLFIETRQLIMYINRKQIIDTLLRIIDHISDKEYQERVWILGKGPEVDDFDETCCNFFPEVDDVIEKYKDFGITTAQYKILKKFRDKFDIFSDTNNWPQEFIDTPEWITIMHLAKDVLKAFNYQKN